MSPHLRHLRRAPVIRLWDADHPFGALLEREKADLLAWAIMRLPMLYRWVLIKHNGLYGSTRRTEQQLAQDLGCSQSTISRIEKSARERLCRIMHKHR